MYKLATITDGNKTIQVQINICSTCRFFIDPPMMPPNTERRCARPAITQDGYMHYIAYGGCPEWQAGVPIGHDLPEKPIWLTMLERAGLSDGLGVHGVSVTIDSNPSNGDQDHDSQYDLPSEYAQANKPKGNLFKAVKDKLLKHDHKNGAPQSVHDPTKGVSKFKIGEDVIHAVYGKANIVNIFQNGRAMIRYTASDGSDDYKAVDASELKSQYQTQYTNTPAIPKFPPKQNNLFGHSWAALNPDPNMNKPSKRDIPGKKPDSITQIGKSKNVYKVSLEGKDYIYKPRYEEDDVKGDHYADSNLWQREIAAYEIDRALGLGIVPKTIKESIAGKGPGSLAEVVSGFTPAQTGDNTLIDNGESFAVLDALTLQSGREWGWGKVGTHGYATGNGQSFLRASQDEKGRGSPFQKKYAGQPIPDAILTKLRSLTNEQFNGFIPASVDPNIKEQANLNFTYMRDTGLIPPPLSGKWWLDPGKKLDAYISTFKQPFADAMQKLKSVLPNAQVDGRLKTVDSLVRDSKHLKVDPLKLGDVAGTRVIVEDFDAQKDAAKKIRSAFNITVDRSLGLKGAGSPTEIDYKDSAGYKAIHMIARDGDGTKPVEIQIRTKRQNVLGEYMHDVFMYPEFETDKAFNDYVQSMGDHYYRLDQGLQSTSPKAPPIAKKYPKGELPDDPLNTK